MDSYHQFLASKIIADPPTGIDAPPELPAALFPFQNDITQWALRRGRAAVFAGTGLGKTLMELAWSGAVHEATGQRVLILAPLCVAMQIDEQAQRFGLPCAHVSEPNDAPVQVTNYQKLDRFDPAHYGGIVLDECFAAGTEIDTPAGPKKIENIELGDEILNAATVDIVADIHRREVHYAVRVTIERKPILCSPNHPFFTQRGWVAAQDLQPGDSSVNTREAVRMVRQGIHAPDEAGGAEEEVLQSILLSEMADAPAGALSESAQPRGSRKARRQEKSLVRCGQPKGRSRTGTDSKVESHVASGGAREGLPPIESDAPRTFRAWGQRAWFDAATKDIAGCARRRLGGGIEFVTGSTDSQLSDALQTRLSESRAKNYYRGGWKLPLQPQGARCKKGRDARFARVDGIEILEQGHPDLERLRDANGKLYFYDLGATRHPSFSVNGCLVHNSSILKALDGKTKARLIESFQSTPYRLAATATPAPNDFMELGNHAEFLGVMSHAEMLATFFVHDGGNTQKWRLKGHAQEDFWRWLSSWAVMLQHPRDLGYDDARFDLPALHYHEHIIAADYSQAQKAGLLIPLEAQTLSERLAAKRASIDERVAQAAALTPADRPFVWWCHLNAESDRLARSIPGAVEVRGSDKEADKERKLMAFSRGEIRTLITKPSICGFGLNWQHCADSGFVGLNDSFEQVYQAIRRFWRFGQSCPVNVHFIASELEGAVVSNLKRKEAQAAEMQAQMVRHMADLTSASLHGAARTRTDYSPAIDMKIPHWLRRAA